jgi:demethylmenaquinone methyltransferase/2-methoxy-6-polyprenyl-1,4-benzoquinol methylase
MGGRDRHRRAQCLVADSDFQYRLRLIQSQGVPDAAFDSPESKRRHVRALFATIADRYDLITALLSYGQDARWKAKLASLANVTPGQRALDLAAGTGDIAFAIAARGAKTIGLDITHRMLQLAHLRQGSGGRAQSHQRVEFITGDMTSLPFRSASFDLVTTGYGLRNVPRASRWRSDEIARVLKPGGRMLSLDFNRPENRCCPLRVSRVSLRRRIDSRLDSASRS